MVRRVWMMAVVLTLASTAPLLAQEAPTVKVDPDIVVLGASTMVSGEGFEAGTVRIYLDSVGGVPLAEHTHKGAFNFLVEIDGVTAGLHEVIACNNQARLGDCREEAATTLTVDPAPTTTTSPPRTTTTTSPPRTTTTTTTTSPPRTTTTTTTTITTSPSRTTTTSAVPRRTTTTVGTTFTTTTAVTGATSTLPPTIAPTPIGELATATTAGPPPTIAPVVGASIPTGPEPTFDPNPDAVAIPTTTEGPSFSSGQDGFPDLFVTSIEVSQGIQNTSSTMPLVADRTTWVRVHVGNEGSGAWTDIDGRLLLQRPGDDDFDILVPDNGPIVSKLPRTDIDSTLNFELPAEWITEGPLSMWAGIWSVIPATVLESEPDPDNNHMHLDVEFHTADVPTIWLVALDDGGGPGPVVDDLSPLTGFADVVAQNLLDFHPTAGVNFEIYPDPVDPGPEAFEPGLWDLGLDQDADADDTADDETAGARRHEPNIRMSLLFQDLPDGQNVLGWVDPSIPTDVYTGWAGYGVAWTKPTGSTPAHELGHSRGLKHVPCKDDDGDGVPDELKGGALDLGHPTGLPPNCSLAPISELGYFGLSTERVDLEVFSNDPTDSAAAFPLMSYRGPKWTGPYHWCLLLDEVGVPCNPGAIGVPPKIIQPAADCDPQPLGGGFGLELCLADELPPVEPFTEPNDSPIAIPQIGVVPCAPDGTLFLVAPSAAGDASICAAAEELFFTVELINSSMSGIDGGSLEAPRKRPPTCLVVWGQGFPSVCPTMSESGTSASTYSNIVLERGYTATDDLFVWAALDPASWLLVSGSVDVTTGAATLTQTTLRSDLPAATVDRYRSGVTSVLAGVTPVSHVIEVVDPAGLVVAHIPLELDGAGHGEGEPSRLAGFLQAVPLPDDCPRCSIVVLAADGSVKASSSMSDHAPVITTVDVVATDAGTEISWAAADADGDELRFDVLWSAPGAGWVPVVSSASESSHFVPATTRFPGGDDIVVRVIANDGVLTGDATSAPFAAPTHAPLLVVTGLPGSGLIEQYATLLLQAHVIDPEDDGQTSNVRWHSSLDGDLGAGILLRTRDLQLGEHEIVVTAEDRDGNVVSETIGLRVVAPASPTRRVEPPDADAIAFMLGEPLPEPAEGTGVGAQDKGSSDDLGAAAGEAASVSAPQGAGWAPWAVAAGAVGLAGGVLVSRRRPDGSGRAGSRTDP